jgi:deoxyribodipyrimidine photo-lyase
LETRRTVFSHYLTDYDPFSNNGGGWQWVSGTGADAQPYYRIFNPYTLKYDPDCIYIKKYIPELSLYDKKIIRTITSNIFDYEKERSIALQKV